MSKVPLFYPSCFALSKQEVIRMIQQRIKDELFAPQNLIHFNEEQQVAALTDERMQRFIDAWGDLVYEAIDPDTTMDEPIVAREQLLKSLAHELNLLLSNTVST